jgi:dTDP-glucose 4,6-dehydratase/UDP-glucose 4-epimerase
VITLKDLAALMTKLGDGGSFELVPFPPERKAIDIGNYYGDFSLIRKELGWSPRIGLSEGLRKTLLYYREHGKHYWD